MKKTLSILALSVLPTLALAAGSHGGGHGMPGHDMSTMSKAPSPTGQPGDPAKVTRTIELTMDDTMRFTPSDIQVNAGETVRFFIKNTGKIPHEMVIGSIADLKAHAAEMQKMPGMQHAEPNMITLAPGKIGGLVWQFDQAGTVDFACLIPGHMEAGMVGKVKVS
ncbi:plastocyanin/azurin family copper-binding protein [Pusillimonas sp. T7-7]|uniref:cupredoxin domain-containing protein n=1 Tax=Pusillimonas sp. (strain T7-7) TaxID=1007105 RepID=UPI00059F9B38|nr:cupredoxin family protein [Pusillimonas sp. T7-7]